MSLLSLDRRDVLRALLETPPLHDIRKFQEQYDVPLEQRRESFSLFLLDKRVRRIATFIITHDDLKPVWHNLGPDLKRLTEEIKALSIKSSAAQNIREIYQATIAYIQL